MSETTQGSPARPSWRTRIAAALEARPHYLLLGLVAVIALFVMPLNVWVSLTVAGLAMGLILFVVSSGMTLIFGLMGVLNLAHGAFITVGAYIGASVFLMLAGWPALAAVSQALLIIPAALATLAAAALLGLVFERVFIKPVYDDHLRQILVTVGGAIIIAELIVVFWGAHEIPLPRPDVLRGAFVFGGVAFEKYRLFAVGVGLAVYWGMLAVIQYTRVGLLIRAGVENGEMVQALGYRIKLLFIAVFAAGTALGAFGGVLWGFYEELIHIEMGEHLLVDVIIVIIMGGLGSITGCFYSALVVGLLTNYMGFVAPTFSEFSSIVLMVLVLMWRPQGLIPVVKV
ncbi:branched-chain amino acid ABC transporter permease [Salinisphaera orenii]|uniref:ABC transporter permease n=1 Tax=Salinisphaera orenii YIM 95161 TaxID=1051139 RepID=A0A423PK74_9GAMM|nr:branched-chain amino acid ABC transporter permease [Salinisphaera halophila]ROO25979.1 ABC transporter permease [Salinisphaera halophila YIM 95161]